MEFCWQQAQNGLVRELGWCLFSSPVVVALPLATSVPWPCREDRGAREILATLDQDPRPLKAHLARLGDKRLGARFEAMWTFFLESHPNYELLAHNWPVKEDGNGRTLGALDLLFRDNSRDIVIHGEVAVKFYLYYPEKAGTVGEQWIGPNPDDNLGLKINHLIDHQLALSARPETRRQLQRAGLPAPDSTAATIKGCLFHPLGSDAPLPPGVDPGHIRGQWLRLGDLPALVAETPGHWFSADKAYWLLPGMGNRIETADIGDKTADLLARAGQPVMLYHQDPSAPATTWRRYLVLPDQWPQAR